MIYQIIGINKTGDVVFNVSTEANFYVLNNVTVCLVDIIRIVAFQGGYNSSVTKEVAYSDG